MMIEVGFALGYAIPLRSRIPKRIEYAPQVAALTFIGAGAFMLWNWIARIV